MQPLVVNIDVATMYPASNGRIGGRIWLQLGTLLFPEVVWFDFPVPLLTSWLQGVRSLCEGRQTSVAHEFLDGPFRATLSVISSSEWCVTLVEDCLQGWRERGQGSFDPKAFLESLLDSSEAVLKVCDAKRWTSSHVEELRKQHEAWQNTR
jgi:hypothetical protein